MERTTMNLAIEIKAPKATVWRVLLDDATYREWTSVFHEGSHFVGDWKEGSEIRFLTPEGQGMVSHVKVHRPEEFISIEHRGLVKNGEVDYDSDEVKAWSGLTENYRVEEISVGTRLRIEQQIGREYADWFHKTWEQALANIKTLAEAAGEK